MIISLATLKGFASFFLTAFFINSLNIGKAVFDPVSYFPNGYWMVHGLDNGTVDIYQVTESTMKRSVGIGNITIQYGGAQGKGKRVNVLCESSKYKFTFNFRGKQTAATYPTHLMCDYKKK